MDLDSLCTQFCDYSLYIRGYTPATIRRYRISLAVFRRAMAVNQIAECTPDAVRGFFFRGRAQRHWKTNTYATYHRSLLVFFRWCVGKGHLPTNPVETIELPKPEKSLPRGLTQQVANRLLEVVRNYPRQTDFQRVRDHAIFATFLHAGLRRQELLQLHTADLDVVNRTLFVRRGKGNKDRIIPLNGALAGILTRYLAARTGTGKTCPEVFTSIKQDHGLTEEGIKRVVAQARTISGIRFSAHRLRHTFATLMLEGGSDIYSISTMMGHSDIKTTTIYLAATAGHLRAQIAKHPLDVGGT